jgi:hypothetical protein
MRTRSREDSSFCLCPLSRRGSGRQVRLAFEGRGCSPALPTRPAWLPGSLCGGRGSRPPRRHLTQAWPCGSDRRPRGMTDGRPLPTPASVTAGEGRGQGQGQGREGGSRPACSGRGPVRERTAARKPRKPKPKAPPPCARPLAGKRYANEGRGLRSSSALSGLSP